MHVVSYRLSAEADRYARVAQGWSIAWPRRGSRVRIPSRALKKKWVVPMWHYPFSFSSPIPDSKVRRLRSASVGAKPRSTGPCAPRLAPISHTFLGHSGSKSALCSGMCFFHFRLTYVLMIQNLCVLSRIISGYPAKTIVDFTKVTVSKT